MTKKEKREIKKREDSENHLSIVTSKNSDTEENKKILEMLV
jgi:hypothetical protein